MLLLWWASSLWVGTGLPRLDTRLPGFDCFFEGFIRFFHIHKKGNQAADYLAHRGLHGLLLSMIIRRLPGISLHWFVWISWVIPTLTLDIFRFNFLFVSLYCSRDSHFWVISNLYYGLSPLVDGYAHPCWCDFIVGLWFTLYDDRSLQPFFFFWDFGHFWSRYFCWFFLV